MRDYKVYRFTVWDTVFLMGESVLLTMVLAFLFYRSLWGGCLVIPVTLWLRTRRKQIKTLRCQQLLRQQFQETLRSVSSGLQAGLSIENSFSDSRKELAGIYGEESMMGKELQYIIQGLSCNEPLEQLMYSFGTRSGIEEIETFAEILWVAKRINGDMVKVLGETATTIQEKIQIQQEIETYLHGKKIEQQILNIMPCGILLYVGICSPDFLAPLYETMFGRIFMTGCLILYGCAVMLAERIGNIQV